MYMVRHGVMIKAYIGCLAHVHVRHGVMIKAYIGCLAHVHVRHGVMINAYIGCLAHVHGEAWGNDQGIYRMPCSCTW